MFRFSQLRVFSAATPSFSGDISQWKRKESYKVTVVRNTGSYNLLQTILIRACKVFKGEVKISIFLFTRVHGRAKPEWGTWAMKAAMAMKVWAAN